MAITQEEYDESLGLIRAAAARRLAFMECTSTSPDVSLPERALVLYRLDPVPSPVLGGEAKFAPKPVALKFSAAQEDEIVGQSTPVREPGSMSFLPRPLGRGRISSRLKARGL